MFTLGPCAVLQYAHLVEEAVKFGTGEEGVAGGINDEKMALILDRLAVNFGLEILKVVPGYVSTEVDARLRCVSSRQPSLYAPNQLTPAVQLRHAEQRQACAPHHRDVRDSWRVP